MIALPDFLGTDSGVIPIRLLTSRELLLEIFPEKPVEMSMQSDPKEVESVSGEGLVDATVLKRKMAELSLGESLQAPSPDILLPPAEEVPAEEERIKRFLASPFYEEMARAFEGSVRPTKSYEGMRNSIDILPGKLRGNEVEDDLGTEMVIMRLKSPSPAKLQEHGKVENIAIQGPIARRELTYLPPIPNVKATIETEFEMKFWVRPNGTVDRVIPVKRAGDVELERVAANYLRQWRFKAIPENEQQVDEWGTVVIKFKLE